MDIHIALGWWLLPLAVTLVAFCWAWRNGDYRPATGYGSIGKGVANVFLLCIATVVSLVAWLIWALSA